MATAIASPRRKAGPQTKNRASTVIIGLTLLLLAAGGALTGYLLATRVPEVAVGRAAALNGLSLTVDRTAWMFNDHSHEDDPSDSSAAAGLPKEVQQLAEARNLEIEEATTAQGQVFPMPASMMPDLPDEGHERLKVELTLQNTGRRSQPFGPGDFRLRSEAGGEWLPRAKSTFRADVLHAGQSVNGVFFFDVPQEEAQDLFIVWQRGGSKIRIPVEAVDVGANYYLPK